MIPVLEERLGFGDKVVDELGHAADYAQGAEGGLVGVDRAGSELSREWGMAQRTFFRIYVLELPRSFSTSLTRSRDISSPAMLANVQSARPTAYMLEWFMSLRAGQVSEGAMSSFILHPRSLLERIGEQHQHLLALVEDHHDAEVTEPLVRVPRARDHGETRDTRPRALHAEHVEVEHLGNAIVPRKRVLCLERRAECR